jgi:hypothetical protein
MYLGAIRPALNGTLAIIVAVSGLRWTMPAGWPLTVRLSLEVAGGGAVYVLILSVLHADRMRSFLALYRRIRAPNAASASS